MYLADLALIKLSILAFYLSIATHRTFRVLVIISITVVSVFSITMIFLNAFECPKKAVSRPIPCHLQPDEIEMFSLTHTLLQPSGFQHLLRYSDPRPPDAGPHQAAHAYPKTNIAAHRLLRRASCADCIRTPHLGTIPLDH